MRPDSRVENRVAAIHGKIFRPASWPPSPGFAPCAILICRSSALTRYSLVTPKRPDATWCTALRLRSPLGSRHVAPRVLPALAGVRLAAEAVHGDRERLVGLGRDAPVGHGARGEPLHDLGDRLHLFDRHRSRGLRLGTGRPVPTLPGTFEPEQAAQASRVSVDWSSTRVEYSLKMS